jgi:cell shape-determining protein MreC
MKDKNTSTKDRKIESQLAVQSTLLAESILDALVSTLLGPYLHYKASKLRNTKEYKNVQKKIKELNDEYEELQKAQEKLDAVAEKGTALYKKSRDYSMSRADKILDIEVQRALKMIKVKDKPTKRL